MVEAKNTPAETPKKTKRAKVNGDRVTLRAGQKDWKYVQDQMDMTRNEITEDYGAQLVVVAYLHEKQETGNSDFNKWFEAPMSDVLDYLGIEYDVDDDEDGNE